MPTPKLFAVPMTIYVEAHSQDMALAVANLYSFRMTEALRNDPTSWIPDRTTITTVSGAPTQVQRHQLPKEAYDKNVLARIYGEDRAIRFLNAR